MENTTSLQRFVECLEFVLENPPPPPTPPFSVDEVLDWIEILKKTNTIRHIATELIDSPAVRKVVERVPGWVFKITEVRSALRYKVPVVSWLNYTAFLGENSLKKKINYRPYGISAKRGLDSIADLLEGVQEVRILEAEAPSDQLGGDSSHLLKQLNQRALFLHLATRITPDELIDHKTTSIVTVEKCKEVYQGFTPYCEKSLVAISNQCLAYGYDPVQLGQISAPTAIELIDTVAGMVNNLLTLGLLKPEIINRLGEIVTDAEIQLLFSKAKREVRILEAEAVEPKPLVTPPIPEDDRSKPMSKKEASVLFGQSVKWLTACIDDGTIQAEKLNRQSYVFAISKFPTDRQAEAR